MGKVKTLDDLNKLRDKLTDSLVPGNKDTQLIDKVHIKVAMATCSIASGSTDTMNYLSEELDKRNIDALVTQTGCMGYCYAEPTIEVIVPGKEPLIFGYVDQTKADEIIEKYIRNGEMVDDVIPVNYKTIDEQD